MKNKFKLALCLAVCVLMLSGCTLLPAATLEAMFRNKADENGGAAVTQAPAEDTVTISREQYEKYQQFDELLELMRAADQYFYKEPDYKGMLQGAAAGLLSGLGDNYTFYYTPEAWQQMWEEDEGEYAGIGLLISANYSTGICTISRVFKGSPAEAAGVQRGDILYKVNGELTVTAETLQEAVDIMRGVPGTTVDVTFMRKGEEITFTIERAIINVNQIESTMLNEETGYIAFYQFAGECDKEFENALNELVKQGAKGIIVDLRDNPGGWVDAALHVGDLFLDAGDLCYLVYRNGEEDHCYPTTDGKIRCGAGDAGERKLRQRLGNSDRGLRDRANATVVGVNTYGKGIVQVVLPVGKEGSGFQMTIARI